MLRRSKDDARRLPPQDCEACLGDLPYNVPKDKVGCATPKGSQKLNPTTSFEACLWTKRGTSGIAPTMLSDAPIEAKNGTWKQPVMDKDH